MHSSQNTWHMHKATFLCKHSYLYKKVTRPQTVCCLLPLDPCEDKSNETQTL